MQRHFPHLEIISLQPANKRKSRAPLLFVHGGYCDAWCWQPHFMPWFAQRGHPVHALSLRGHGGSDGHETLFGASVDDYVADVLRAIREIDREPILIGHSMGAAVIERILQRHPLRGAALLAPLPPSGLAAVASRLMLQRPDHLLQMARFDQGHVAADVLAALHPYYFTDDIDANLLREADRHLCAESSRALFDLTLRTPLLRTAPESPLFVLGARGDRVCQPADVAATAAQHGVEATMIDGLAHMLMLVPGWERAAAPLAAWIDGIRNPART
ncbi:MAG: alpha/beta fold hydrolase [Casimicrobiaceae bacterium]